MTTTETDPELDISLDLEDEEDEEFSEELIEDDVPELSESDANFVHELVDRIWKFITYFSGIDMFPYQEEFGKRIIESIVLADGDTISGEFSRQSGKTETLANVISGLMVILPILAKMYPRWLDKFKRGFWVGCFAPIESQVETLFGRIVDRLTSEHAMEIMEDPEIGDMPKGGGQKLLRLRKSGSFCRMQTANPRAKIESKSYHFIVVDEAQGVDEYVLGKSIEPMGAFYLASMVMIGTPDVVKGAFYKTIQYNRRVMTRKGSKKNHFRFDWKYCNPPEAPIWMGDFSFKPLGEVKVGDEVIGWSVKDTTLPYNRWGTDRGSTRTRHTRRLTRAVVTDVQLRQAPIYKLTMASGEAIRCTGDHLWLSGRSRYAHAAAHQVQGGEDYFIQPDVGRKLVRVVHPTPTLDPSLQRTADWLAGVWDGEGSGLRIAQSPDFNPEVYKAIGEGLQDLGIVYTERYDGHYMQGGRQTLTDFLNWTEPVKRSGDVASREILRGKFMRETDEIVAMEFDGVGEVISMTTTTGNYVAWGYASKNCARYNPSYKSAVRKQARRLGEDSDEFRLNYRLEWLLERGMFITEDRMDSLGDSQMQLVHSWWKTPCLAGIDCARKMDSTVVTVVWVDWDHPDADGLYDHRILDWLEIHGENWEEQYFQISDFLGHFNIMAAAIDAQGMGDVIADRLSRIMPRTQIVPLDSTRPAQSSRWKHLQQLIQKGLISWPAHPKAKRTKIWKRFRQQMVDLEKKYEQSYLLAEAPDEAEAHDDFPDSLALACVLTKEFLVEEAEMTSNPMLEYTTH